MVFLLFERERGVIGVVVGAGKTCQILSGLSQRAIKEIGDKSMKVFESMHREPVLSWLVGDTAIEDFDLDRGTRGGRGSLKERLRAARGHKF